MLETAYEYLVQVGHRLTVTVTFPGVGVVVQVLVPVPRQGVRIVGILAGHELHGGDQYGLAGDTSTLRETFSHHREMGKRVTVLFLPLAELVTEVEQQCLAVVTGLVGGAEVYTGVQRHVHDLLLLSRLLELVTRLGEL